jgi:hypothetical protein
MAINAPNSTSGSSNQKMESFDGDNSIGTLLLEVLALEIQMYTDRKENKKLRVGHDCSTYLNPKNSPFFAPRESRKFTIKP